MNKTEFNRNFLIEFHPSQKKKWKKKLIGLDKMKELIGNAEIFEDSMKKIQSFTGDTIWIRIRQGVAFHIRCK